MKVYITATFKGGENREEIEQLCKLVKESGFEDFCFIRDIENYEKVFHDPQELMQRTNEEIEKCDALLIDFTNKPTGRALEAGMAYTQGKKIISIMKQGTKIKDTSVGVSDAIIEYEDIEDIVIPLKELFEKWR